MFILRLLWISEICLKNKQNDVIFESLKLDLKERIKKIC